MKLLHLYSDWKWTGPAEPAMQACRSLMDFGHDVVFACPEPPVDYDENVGDKARELGLQVTHELGLNRYFKIGPTVHDAFAVPRLLRRERFDIVHCHLSHDHALAAFFCRLPGVGRPRVVRSLYKREVLPENAVNRCLLRRLTDGCVTFTDRFREHYIQRFNLAPERVAVSPMSLDLGRFRPDAPRTDMRQTFGLPADAPVIGIVGRFQRYRRAEVFVQAAHRLLQVVPEAKFLIIGRSSQMRETVVEPVNALGIGDAVVFSGYRREDYVDTLACLDVFSLLMPGFDGTARAVREALALGKPCVVSDYGMLPEIVRHGETGYVVATEAEALADGWRKLIQNRTLYETMAQAAATDAVKRFPIDGVAPVLSDLYDRVLSHT